MADYNQAIQLNPNNARAYRNRGNAKRNKGDLDGAIADFNRAIELNAKHAPSALEATPSATLDATPLATPEPTAAKPSR
jgi:tetratricopeptide (TPR) repeat protein